MSALCGICNLDLAKPPRHKKWSQLLERFPSLRDYFNPDRNVDGIHIGMDVDIVTSNCNVLFHNMCITEWFKLTKSPECPNTSCPVRRNTFAAMRKHHFTAIMEGQETGQVFRTSEAKASSNDMSGTGRECLIKETLAVAAVNDSGGGAGQTNKEVNLIAAGRGDLKLNEPKVAQFEIGHNNNMTTKITTFHYTNKSRLVRDEENSAEFCEVSSKTDLCTRPNPMVTNDLLDKGSSKLVDEPIVFSLAAQMPTSSTIPRLDASCELYAEPPELSTDSDSVSSGRSRSSSVEDSDFNRGIRTPRQVQPIGRFRHRNQRSVLRAARGGRDSGETLYARRTGGFIMPLMGEEAGSELFHMIM